MTFKREMGLLYTSLAYQSRWLENILAISWERKKESTISKFLGYMIEYIIIQGKTNSSCARIPERSIHTIASNPANPDLLCAKQPSRQQHNHSTQFQQNILVQIETLLTFQTR